MSSTVAAAEMHERKSMDDGSSVANGSGPTRHCEKDPQTELHIQSLCEMFPMLRREEIAMILFKRHYQFLPSIDACLTLAGRINQQSHELRLSVHNTDAPTSRFSGHYAKPPMVHIAEETHHDDEKVHSDGATARAPVPSTASSDGSSGRGNRVQLPDSFLKPPSFRFISEATDSEFQNFSVVFYRLRGKLGIQVGRVQTFIVVRGLACPGESPTNQHHKRSKSKAAASPASSTPSAEAAPAKGMAERAGVMAGDILTGFDGGLFTPGVQVEDIAWQLAKPRDYLTLHFKRPLHDDFWNSENRLHPLATVLLHQNAVDLIKAQEFTESIAAVTARIQKWRSGFITQRVVLDHADNETDELDAPAATAAPDICISTRSLHPALCVRIVGTTVENEKTLYIISVVDVASDLSWTVSRRFRQFYELKEKLLAELPSIAQLPFPHRKLTWSETLSIVNNRQHVLEQYLRTILAMPLLNRLHKSTSRIHGLLQEFLDVPQFSKAMDNKLSGMQLHEVCRQTMQTHIHGILNIPQFQDILNHFFGQCGRQPGDSKWVGSGPALVKLVSQFLDSLQFILIDTISSELQEVAKEHSLDVNGAVVEQLINAAIRRQVETEVYIPLQEVLFAAARSEIKPAHTFQVAQLPIIRSNPQSAFDIQPEHISLSSWESAIDLMREVNRKHIPYDKLKCLVEACKEIPSLYIREHPTSPGALAADDFLPIFIYVLVNADIDGLLELKYILPEMCETSQRLAEPGYYVATLAAAVEHLVERAN